MRLVRAVAQRSGRDATATLQYTRTKEARWQVRDGAMLDRIECNLLTLIQWLRRFRLDFLEKTKVHARNQDI